MRIGSLFSGIGGFELGLQRGMPGASVAWQVEIDSYCRSVLARHWPDAERHEDVCRVGAHNLAPIDVLCGGFPCQDISTAGTGAGLAGARSGLWFEMLRIIEETRPAYVVAENVAALRTRGLPVVLDGLARAGYLATWAIISAADVGAPHKRARMWIVASRRDVPQVIVPRVDCIRSDVWPRGGDPEPWERGIPRTIPKSFNLGHRRARLHALGNAVVPQIPEMIGRAIASAGEFSLTGQTVAPGAYLPTPTKTERDNAGGSNPGPVRPCLSTMARGDLWPTPRASMDAGGHTGRGAIDSLHSAVKTWPTPTVHGDYNRAGLSANSGNGLATAVKTWPTPTCNDSYNDAPPSQFLRKTIPLNCAAAGAVGGGKLNPQWVELLMGYPPGWTVPR